MGVRRGRGGGDSIQAKNEERSVKEFEQRRVLNSAVDEGTREKYSETENDNDLDRVVEASEAFFLLSSSSPLSRGQKKSRELDRAKKSRNEK